MTEASLPIFIVDDLDISSYKSLDEALLGLEPIDIQNNAYIMYDAEGRVVQLATDGKRITPIIEDEPSHAIQLETSLRKFLRLIGETVADDANCNLPCLVDTCLKYI
jgi:hypothetical protein